MRMWCFSCCSAFPMSTLDSGDCRILAISRPHSALGNCPELYICLSMAFMNAAAMMMSSRSSTTTRGGMAAEDGLATEDVLRSRILRKGDPALTLLTFLAHSVPISDYSITYGSINRISDYGIAFCTFCVTRESAATWWKSATVGSHVVGVGEVGSVNRISEYGITFCTF